MKTDFRRVFVRDLEQVRDRALRRRVQEVIEQVEGAGALQEMRGARKLQGSGQFYRIRVGSYRLGLALEGDVVVFVRFLHRKDIYRHFP